MINIQVFICPQQGIVGGSKSPRRVLSIVAVKIFRQLDEDIMSSGSSTGSTRTFDTPTPSPTLSTPTTSSSNDPEPVVSAIPEPVEGVSIVPVVTEVDTTTSNSDGAAIIRTTVTEYSTIRAPASTPTMVPSPPSNPQPPLSISGSMTMPSIEPTLTSNSGATESPLVSVDDEKPPSMSSQRLAEIGGGVGGALAVIIILYIIIAVLQRRRKRRHRRVSFHLPSDVREKRMPIDDDDEGEVPASDLEIAPAQRQVSGSTIRPVSVGHTPRSSWYDRESMAPEVVHEMGCEDENVTVEPLRIEKKMSVPPLVPSSPVREALHLLPPKAWAGQRRSRSSHF